MEYPHNGEGYVLIKDIARMHDRPRTTVYYAASREGMEMKLFPAKSADGTTRNHVGVHGSHAKRLGEIVDKLQRHRRHRRRWAVKPKEAPRLKPYPRERVKEIAEAVEQNGAIPAKLGSIEFLNALKAVYGIARRKGVTGQLVLDMETRKASFHVNKQVVVDEQVEYNLFRK